MAKKNGLDYIYVVWQDPKSRSKFVIGTLTRNGHYEFTYGEELEQAKKCGFMPMAAIHVISHPRNMECAVHNLLVVKNRVNKL